MQKRARIGVILPEITDLLEYEFLSGIHAQAASLGYDVIVFTDTFNAIPEHRNSLYVKGLENIYELPFCSGLEGILFAEARFRSTETSAYILNKLRTSAMPYIALHPEHTDIAVPQRSTIYELTQHLISDHNCRNLYCITGIPDEPSSTERLQGFLDAMQEAGLSVTEDQVFYGYYWQDVPMQIGKDIGSGSIPKPDAIICTSDIMAAAVCNGLQETGLSVPQDVRVTGYDGSWAAFMNHPQITTALGRDCQLGCLAVCRLHELLTGQHCEPLVQQQQIRYSGSCGCESIASMPLLPDHPQPEEYMKRMYLRYVNTKTFRTADLSLRLDQTDSMKSLMEEISQTIYLIEDARSIHICLCENWMFQFEDPSIYRSIGFSDRMFLALSSQYYQRQKDGFTFSTFQILPFLSVPHEPCLTVLTSLHHGDQVFGYTAVTYQNAIDICVDGHFLAWRDAVSDALNRLQNRMFEDYIREQVSLLSVYDPETGLYNEKGFFHALPIFRSKTKGDIVCILLTFADRCLHNRFPIDRAQVLANALRLSTDQNELYGRLNEQLFGLCLAEPTSDEIEQRLAWIEEKQRELLHGVSGFQNTVLLYEIVSLTGQTLGEITEQIGKHAATLAERAAAAANAQGSYREQLAALRRQVYTEPQASWNTNTAAQMLGVSESHFRRIYKQEFAITFQNDLIRARTEKAKRLLSQTTMQVQVIADLCGYSHLNHFMRQFKGMTGMTAAEYRTQQNDSCVSEY